MFVAWVCMIYLSTVKNTTFGGIQGFTRKPSTPWYDDEGHFAGVVHQERGWTYALFYGAGHMVPRDRPDVVRYFLQFLGLALTLYLGLYLFPRFCIRRL